jgi:hypothetical protein
MFLEKLFINDVPHDDVPHDDVPHDGVPHDGVPHDVLHGARDVHDARDAYDARDVHYIHNDAEVVRQQAYSDWFHDGSDVHGELYSKRNTFAMLVLLLAD